MLRRDPRLRVEPLSESIRGQMGLHAKGMNGRTVAEQLVDDLQRARRRGSGCRRAGRHSGRSAGQGDVYLMLFVSEVALREGPQRDRPGLWPAFCTLGDRIR